MIGTVIAAVRGCGTRVKGSIYWEFGIGPGGTPLEEFLLDPPRRVPEGLVIPNRGVGYLTDGAGTTHLVDRVGLQHYPNVLDMVREIGNFGLSRRLPKGIDVARLDPTRSRLLLVHDRAIVENYAGLVTRIDIEVECPKHLPYHPSYADRSIRPRYVGTLTGPIPVLDPMCIHAWDHTLYVPGQELEPGTLTVRIMPSFSYTAYTPPDGWTPDVQPGIFASFPCGRIAAVRDDEDAGFADFVRRLMANSPIPVEEVIE